MRMAAPGDREASVNRSQFVTGSSLSRITRSPRSVWMTESMRMDGTSFFCLRFKSLLCSENWVKGYLRRGSSQSEGNLLLWWKESFNVWPDAPPIFFFYPLVLQHFLNVFHIVLVEG